MSSTAHFIGLKNPQLRSVALAMAGMAGLPIAWNIVARNEYRRHTIERALGGRARLGAYALALAIFTASAGRDVLFARAVKENGSDVMPALCQSAFGETGVPYVRQGLKVLAATLMTAGTTLVLSATARLGIVGTYLGDYFGILKDSRVTAFPFNILENPMYVGSLMNFLAAALWENSAVGVGLTGWMGLVYYVSCTFFENPFTSMIYGERDAKRAAEGHTESSPAPTAK